MGGPPCRQGCACPLPWTGGACRAPAVIRGAGTCGPGLSEVRGRVVWRGRACPPRTRGWGPGPRPLAVPLHRLAAEKSFLLVWGKAELWGSLGVDLPVIRGAGLGAFVLRWQPVWGDRPVSGCAVRVPRNRREGASVCLWDQGCPVTRGPASALASRALCGPGSGSSPL